MRGAFNASRLHTRYQPVVSTSDRTPYALEVLARLDHPELGMLFPSQFVPQIEDAGLARQLTRAVVDLALLDYASHLHALDLMLALNFPLDVLMDDDLPEWLERRCSDAGLAHAQLIIELTESQPVADLGEPQRRALSAAITRLRRCGCRIAIDDFGPAMPRRHELFDLPFDLLKLDKAMVAEGYPADLVAQTVRTAHRSGFRVIAEGIEEAATWARMQAFGVDYLQGYLISRPLPCDGVSDWMGRWTAGPSG